MKVTQEQFNTAKKSLLKKSLSSDKKSRMLSQIYTKSTPDIGVVPSPFSTYFSLLQKRSFVALAGAVLMFSGTVYASANSLPGDFLYGVKVDVIEPLNLALKFSEESKQKYKVLLLEKRIAEIEILKQRGVLSESSQKESHKAADKNIKNIQQGVSGAVEVEDISIKVRAYTTLINAEPVTEEVSEMIYKKEEENAPAIEIKSSVTEDGIIDVEDAALIEQTPTFETESVGL